MNSRPIGIFDSGVGGLTVVNQIMKHLPDEEIVYFGDTARLPYGSKSQETVTKFSRQIIRFLLTKNVKAILIACNTACSNSLDILKKEFDTPIFGVVDAGAHAAVKTTKNNKIGIIATKSTVNSRAYENIIKRHDPSIKVFSKACPLFVPLVEEGFTENKIAYLTAQIYLQSLLDKGIDSLILGCTHYPLLRKCIEETAGHSITCIDPAIDTSLNILRFLQSEKKLRRSDSSPFHHFYVSDDAHDFETMCQKVLNQFYLATLVDIEKY